MRLHEHAVVKLQRKLTEFILLCESTFPVGPPRYYELLDEIREAHSKELEEMSQELTNLEEIASEALIVLEKAYEDDVLGAGRGSFGFKLIHNLRAALRKARGEER